MESVFSKKKVIKKSFTTNSTRKNSARRNPNTFSLPNRKNTDAIKAEIEELLKMFPGSPEFLGRAEYTVQKKTLGFIKRSYPDISELREQVNKFSAKEGIGKSRPQIKKLLKRYPAYPDLRALNAIQLFSDVSQSGLNSKKIKVMQGALREISRAIYNGGLNLLNVNWFVKIYIRYLDSLREKYQQVHNASKTYSNKEIQHLSKQLRRKLIQMTVMTQAKTKLSGLELLNAKLKETNYAVSNITPEEIKKATLAVKNGEGAKKVGEGGKSASNIIFIVITLNMLFARIPILKTLVNNLQENILDVSREITLQKIMVSNMQQMTEFQMYLAAGDKDKTQEIARKIYLNQKPIINQYLSQGLLTKQYEIDPFIKTAWIAKEANGLFSDEDYRKMLENAYKTVDQLFGIRVQAKGAAEIAGNLRDEIQFIMIEKGWMAN